jgi:hypothetical protein
MKLFFLPDYGDSDRALGYYDEDKDVININLNGIYIECLLDFYGMIPEPPIEYQEPKEFDSYLSEKISRIVEHEHIHRALTFTEGKVISLAFDNVGDV